MINHLYHLFYNRHCCFIASLNTQHSNHNNPQAVIVKNYISIEGEYFYELLPGFVLAFIAIVLVSKITAKPSSATLEKFD